MPVRHLFRTLLAATGLALVTSCAAPPPPAPAPAPPPDARPTPAPVAPLPPNVGWRDAPITPGTWAWTMSGNQSVARFAGGELSLVCDRRANAVTLLRRGETQGSVPATILTTIRNADLSAVPLDQLPPHVAITFAPNDPVLDAMAFSRGRFAVEVMGLPTIIAPSWPEVSRVIEDCR
jgi:hypothetical protein